MSSPMLLRLPRGYRNDHRFGLVYDAQPAGADDLTVISGISTREAVVLNRLGVYFVAQIGLWRRHEMSAFAEEMQIPPRQMAEQGWVEQARSFHGETHLPLNTAASELPASFLRSITLLTCALMVGFCCVYLLGSRRSQMLQGVLSADITVLKVPTTARLVAAHVKSGDEVFSGAPLLTLEKVSHLTAISEQQRRVERLQQELQQAQAKSDLEISWRVREVERELFEARTQFAALQQVQQNEPGPHISGRQVSSPGRTAEVTEASGRRDLLTAELPCRSGRQMLCAGGLLFYSGSSGQFTIIPVESGLPPLPIPGHSAPTMIAQAIPASVSEPVASAIAGLQTQAFESRLERLETMRAALPDQVRQAAGLENLRLQYADASRLLEEMQSVSRELQISAPSHGVIGQIRFRDGDHMAEGEVMLKILHTDRRYVMMYVPTRRVTELQPGSRVDLLFPGRQRYQGEVIDVPMLAETVVPGGESLAAVRIEPVGKLWPQVPIGSQVDVSAAR